MEQRSFTIDYYGRKAQCIEEGSLYRVQITYMPVFIERKKDEEGNEHWIENSVNEETSLSKELGRMIREQYLD